MFDSLDELSAHRRKLFAHVVAMCFDARLKEISSVELLRKVNRAIEEAAKVEVAARGRATDAD